MSPPLPPDMPTLHPDPDSSESHQGRAFGRYRLVEELGRGGMGMVWKAWDTRLRRVVALKQILAQGEKDRGRVERFLREARLAGKLSHPGIVQVHDTGEHEGQHFLTCDYVEGRQLSELLKTPVAASKAVAWTRAVAEALAYAHEQGVIHRDVKPHNILIDGDDKPHVLDFGLAKEVDTFATGALTVSGDLLGTPAYMSPEQATGRLHLLGPATDQFSLGTVLYQLLTERMPFEGATLRDLLNHIAERDPVPPTSFRADIHRDLEAICLKALEKDPARRYPSMRELAADLGRYLDGETIAARQVGPLGRLMRRAARHRRVVAPVAGLSVVAVAALVWAVVGWVKRESDVAAIQSTGRQEAIALAEAEADAMRMIEAGRPALDEASRYLYDKEANHEELVRRLEKGKAWFEHAVTRAPRLALGHYLLGRTWKLLAWPERAEACWREAIRLDARFAPAHFHLGLLKLEQGTAAATLLSPIERGKQREVRANALLIEARKSLDAAAGLPVSAGDEESGDLLEAALAFAGNDALRAQRVCEEALVRLGEAPGSEWFHFLLAHVGDWGEHDERVERVLAIRPRHPQALLCRGSRRLDQGDLDGAIADLSHAIDIHPRLVEALVNRGQARESRGEMDEAISDFDRAIDIDSGLTMAYVNRGFARRSKGDIDGAIADYDRAIDLDPTVPEAFANRALAREAKGELDGALQDFERALQEAAPGWEHRGQVEAMLERLRQRRER